MLLKIGIFIIISALSNEISGFTQCPKLFKNDLMGYNRCVFQLIEELKPQLAEGIPEAHIPPLQPVKYSALSVSYNFTMMQVRANMSNIRTSDLVIFNLKDLWIDPVKMTARVKMWFPSVRFQMNYDIVGKLVTLPITSAGYFEGNFTNAMTEVFATLKDVVGENNVKEIAVDTVKLKVETTEDSGVKINLQTPLRQKVTAKAIELFVNKNPKLVLYAGLPFVTSNAELVTKSYYNQMLKGLRKDDLLPPV